MVNTEEFIKRLEIILEYYGLTASSFADKIGVQRSSISHLLSGRNKPSLDFILKLKEKYSEVEFEWILNGIGSFPKENSTSTPSIALDQTKSKIEIPVDLFSNDLEDKNTTAEVQKIHSSKNFGTETEIERIVIFFKNGTFKNYIT
ncbi:helix-turn-helix transcriptional regulator [uncultured Flavobacterium sp.]|uniref:helix-turn-helix transcriptional regulator n=1 Tax=uncultured Flavobacterium sp. TaxID=165435 RepID=UPI0030CA544C|tara:strand:+ start:402 stop:839 length:438 start_codon:yes stop_codon:yes gene_type:complete